MHEIFLLGWCVLFFDASQDDCYRDAPIEWPLHDLAKYFDWAMETQGSGRNFVAISPVETDHVFSFNGSGKLKWGKL